MIHDWYNNWIKYERGDMNEDQFLNIISDAIDDELKSNNLVKTRYNIFRLLFPIEIIHNLPFGSIMEKTIDYHILLGTYLMRQQYPVNNDDAWVAMQHVGCQNDFVIAEWSTYSILIQEKMEDEIQFHPTFFDEYHQLLLNTWLHKYTLYQNMKETIFLVGIFTQC